MLKKVDVVGAVIVNENNEVLCALRSQDMSLPGLWEFPGGKIEKGEDPKDSLMREIKEELDCGIEVGDLVADATYEYTNVVVRLITYLAKVVEGEPKASEHETLTWLPKDKLSSLNWAPADLPTLDRLLNEDIL
ncbi:(deoxy)nucleoside triphosphate pyrophosphohydrolase [Tumebacillus lipolyticus]|uniref:8-oxo-dGTP diphosphatase n=1 Tax=Tumebacillus lipolyticus TaxID=1280370 RepID=A0ABW4ZUN7_9BACL